MTAEPPTPAQPSRKRRLGLGLATAAVIAVVALGVQYTQAGADESPVDVAAAQADIPRYVDGVIRFSSTYAERIGMSTEVAQVRSLAPTTEVTGRVDVSPGHVAAVGARIFGRVRSVHVELGQEVQRGESLASLDSAELGRAQAEFVEAQAKERFAEGNHDRQEHLVAEGISAQRRVEQATNELEAARARRRAAEQAVRSMGGATSAKSLGHFELRSPIAGEVLEVDVYRGQAVGPEHTAFMIADLSHLWLELAVYENDLPNVHVGDDVVVRPQGEDSAEVNGVVEHVASVIDMASRSATVRIALDNSKRQLRVGQAVRASITARSAEVSSLAVPRRAVVLVDGEPTVFVVPREGEVVPRPVVLGVFDHDYVAIEEGLTAGEDIVVGGVFELKSELFR